MDVVSIDKSPVGAAEVFYRHAAPVERERTMPAADQFVFETDVGVLPTTEHHGP